MQQKIYLHNYILKIFSKYGGADNCINKIIDEAMSGKFDYEDSEPAPERSDGKYVYVNIVNQDFIQLINMYGVKSKRVSLRRMIYKYIDEELYEYWKPEKSEEERVELIRRYGNAIDAMRRLANVTYGKTQDDIRNWLNGLYKMSKEIMK